MRIGGRMIKKAILAASIAMLGACVASGDPAGSSFDTVYVDSETNDAFDAVARKFRVDEVIPSLSVAIAKGDAIVFTGNYGFQDHDGEEPTTDQTSYLAASITKTFAAATLLAMEADGHVSLDDDFTTFSEWDRRCNWLVNSGIIFGGAEIEGLTIPPLDCDVKISLENVLSHRVNGTPGADFIYNPIIFGRLSNYVEEKTEKPWREWMREYVFEPGGLEGIAAGWRDPDGADVLTHFAPPFKHVGSEVDADGFASSVLPNTELNASSGVIASASALAKYGAALLRGDILPPHLIERMWTPTAGADGAPEPYGLGWYVEEIKGRKVVWHGGWWPDAYAGMIVIVPEDNLVFVALGNTDGVHWNNPLNGADISGSPLAAAFFDYYLK